MKKSNVNKTYSVEEMRESLDRYLDASAQRLRLRLKAAWKKQTSKQPLYDKAKV